MFDFTAHLKRLVERNRLAQARGFVFGTCTGITGLEAMMENFSTQSHFVLSDDITTGETFYQSGAWFHRRTFTVFILARYDFDNEPQRTEALSLCRELSRQLQSHFVLDRSEYQTQDVDFKVEAMPSSEIAQFFGNGLTGLYFMLSIDEPLNLCYDENEWD